MILRFISVFSIILVLYVFLNRYIYIHIWQLLYPIIGTEYENFFRSIFVLLGATPFVARLGRLYFPRKIDSALTIVGYYWLGAIYFFILSWLCIDTILLISQWLGIFPETFIKAPPFLGWMVVIAVPLLLIYGSLNAQRPRVQCYDISIAKKVEQLPTLHAVLVSDLHLDVTVDSNDLKSMIDKMNSLNPDIIFFAGDIIDENATHFIEQKMSEVFKQLRPKLGMYAVLGNHDYIGGDSERIVECLSSAGMTVLRDDYVKVANQFYVVGRDDLRSKARGLKRLNLDSIMNGINHTLPIILLDHQPYSLEEGKRQKVDLQLSGHTHRGQLFPLHAITRKVFEIDWGHLKKDNYQIIVSSGLGTWGPPIRIGNSPEIVDITIRFET